MKTDFSIEMIPSSLDITELMEVKGGISDSPNHICIFRSAVTCEAGSVGVATCTQGSAVPSPSTDPKK